MLLARNRRNPRFALVTDVRSEGEARTSTFGRKEGAQGEFGVERRKKEGGGEVEGRRRWSREGRSREEQVPQFFDFWLV